MFSAVRSTHTQSLEAWRDAAAVVAERWQLFLDARPASRALAFAAYLAALDAEEAAAGEIAGARFAA
jgi:hypothetical protein